MLRKITFHTLLAALLVGAAALAWQSRDGGLGHAFGSLAQVLSRMAGGDDR